jgi:hypothetical protein
MRCPAQAAPVIASADADLSGGPEASFCRSFRSLHCPLANHDPSRLSGGPLARRASAHRASVGRLRRRFFTTRVEDPKNADTGGPNKAPSQIPNSTSELPARVAGILGDPKVGALARPVSVP